MRQTDVLYDQADPTAHLIFEVRRTPKRVLAYGLGVSVIGIEVLVGPAPVGTQGVDYEWVPLARQGQYVQLTNTHNHYLELVPGYYRLDMSGADPAELQNIRIIAVHDESSNDSKAMVLVESSNLACQRDFQP